MKQKTIIKTLASITAVMAMLPMLGGCGNSLQNARKPLTASQAFSQQGIWYFTDEDDKRINAETKIYDVLHFDGKGNVTHYDVGDSEKPFTVASLQKMKPEEVLDFAKKKDKEQFESAKKSFISSLEPELEKISSEEDDLQAEKTGLQQDLVEAQNELSKVESWPYAGGIWKEKIVKLEKKISENDEKIQKLSSNRQQRIDAVNASIKAAKDKQYTERKAQKYTLKINTDKLGDTTKAEYLYIPSCRYKEEGSVHDPEGKFWVSKFGCNVNANNVAELTSYGQVKTVGDISFSGYNGTESGYWGYGNTETLDKKEFWAIPNPLVTIVNQKHAGFIFDQPDTKSENVTIGEAVEEQLYQ